MPYTPTEYWSDLHDRGDLSAVGQSGLPSAMNFELYRVWARNLKRFLRSNGCDRIGPNVFEVGAGTGYWFELWRELGAQRIDGCDLVPAAVDLLNRRSGATGRFHVANLGTDQLDFGTYDFVACLNVLLHITDDSKFDAAVGSIARLVAPGGRLLLKEPMLFRDSFARPYRPNVSSRARPLSRYARGLEQEGLQLEAVAGGTAIANNPIEGRGRAAYFMWRGTWAAVSLPAKVHPASARWVGALLYRIDPLVMAMGAAPSSKFALFARPA
jgi:SAM-dependent methyltransferase